MPITKTQPAEGPAEDTLPPARGVARKKMANKQTKFVQALLDSTIAWILWERCTRFASDPEILGGLILKGYSQPDAEKILQIVKSTYETNSISFQDELVQQSRLNIKAMAIQIASIYDESKTSAGRSHAVVLRFRLQELLRSLMPSQIDLNMAVGKNFIDGIEESFGADL